MTRVFLLRHGHVDNPAQLFYGPDTPLSPRGLRQATALAEKLQAAEVQPSLIISSPYLRTQQTTRQIASIFQGVPLLMDDRLVEWQVGDWFGKPLKDFYDYTKYDQHPAGELPSNIESLEQCAARIQAVLMEVVEQNQGKTIFVVSHREPMASAILKYEQKGWEAIHALHFPYASAWELPFEGSAQPVSCTKYLDCSRLE